MLVIHYVYIYIYIYIYIYTSYTRVYHIRVTTFDLFPANIYNIIYTLYIYTTFIISYNNTLFVEGRELSK